MTGPCPDCRSGLCDACAGAGYATPEPPAPGGAGVLTRRVGRHGSFKDSMLSGLARTPALADLATREDDDPTIALADAWAVVLDVLTFYQERIAEEGYLGTARERRSVLELAAAIGYRPGGGVAASVVLAFDLETAPGAPTSVTIPPGIRGQTTPGPDELPQTFETVEPLLARPGWNRLEPRRRALRPPRAGQQEVLLAGTTTGLAVGSWLLIAREPDGPFDTRRIVGLEVVDAGRPGEAHTRVLLDEAIAEAVTEDAWAEVRPVRDRAALFGHNAPNWPALPRQFRAEYVEAVAPHSPDVRVGGAEWPGFTAAAISGADRQLMLDAVYPSAVPGALVRIATERRDRLARIVAVSEVSRSAFGLSAKGSLLVLDRDLAELSPRDVSVWIAGAPLDLHPEPIVEPIEGRAVALVAPPVDPDGLAGRLVVFRDAATGAGEAATVAGWDGKRDLLLTRDLAGRYDRATVEILANCARGTHGETIRPAPEILGGGSGARAFQAFTLKRGPLTRVRSDTAASGSVPTLEVRVDGVAWREVPGFLGRSPSDRVYTLRLDEAGAATVRFGDGRTGARLPTGSGNVTATYRVGTGRAGLVAGGRIDTLIDRPLGVRGLRNPLPSEGAADPETLDQARAAAPRGVLTLDRVVSAGDLEAFARAFAGIGKAVVTEVWAEGRAVAHLTVTGERGDAVPEGSATLAALRRAVAGAAADGFAWTVQSFAARGFGLDATLRIAADREPARVEAAARALLAERFGFDRRSFAQPVRSSEVIAALQAVDGVESVVLRRLFTDGDEAPGLPSAAEGSLAAARARFEGGAFAPAALLVVDLTSVTLAVTQEAQSA